MDITDEVIRKYRGKVVELAANASPAECRRAVEKTFGIPAGLRGRAWENSLTEKMGWRRGVSIAPYLVLSRLWPHVDGIAMKVFFGPAVGGQFMGGGGLTWQEKALVGVE